MAAQHQDWGRPKKAYLTAGKPSDTKRRLAEALRAHYGRPATEEELQMWASKPPKALRRLLEGNG